METNQPTPATTPVATVQRSSFGPGSVSFLIGVLLFLLPFVDIKCGGTTIKEVRGFELATGFKVEDKSMNQSLFGNMGLEQSTNNNKAEKRDPNIFALAALGLGIIAFIIAFLAKGGRSVPAAFMGLLASVAIIALMINIKTDPSLNTTSKTNNNTDGFNMNLDTDIIRVEFTPWIYLTILLFLVGAYFSWRKQSKPVESIPAAVPPPVEESPLGTS
jgi:hypothetical protein